MVAGPSVAPPFCRLCPVMCVVCTIFRACLTLPFHARESILKCLHSSLTNCKHVELKRWHKNIFMKFVIAYVVFEINLKNKGKHVCTRKASSINKLFALECKSVEALGEYLS